MYEFTMKDIDGRDVKLDDYKGKAVMIVNTASYCGNTPQYAELESMYGRYRNQGLEILAFPANNFGSQEPGTEAERQPQRRSLLLDWPDDLTAHTVVLVTTSDRAAARRLARQAARSGIEAGLLRGEDYNLGAGLWIVFAGRFDTPEGASQQATDLAERFPGAYPQLVEPAG